MRELARRTFDRALAECNIPEPCGVIWNCAKISFVSARDIYDLQASAINVVSIGKAGHGLAQALTEIADPKIAWDNLLSQPRRMRRFFGFRYFIGGHPLPNHDSLRAGDAILKLLGHSMPDALTIFLISGGASAIAEKPSRPPFRPEDVVDTYKALVNSGAPISRDQCGSQAPLCR